MRTLLFTAIIITSGCQGETSQDTSQPAKPTTSVPTKKLLVTYDIRDSAGGSLRLSDESAQQLTTQLMQRLDPSEENQIKAQVREAFYGEDSQWKADVWARGQEIVEQALAGVNG